jgi:hypothetical protein
MFGFSAETLSLFEKSLARKIYNFPASRFDSLKDKLAQPSINQGDVLPSLEFKQTEENINVYGGVRVIHFYNEKFMLSQSNEENTFFIVLKNEENNETYLIAPFRFAAFRKDFMFKNQVFGSGFSFVIQQDSVKKGRYRIGLLIFENGKTEIKYTDNLINVNNTKMIDYLQQFGFYQ